MLRIRLTRVGKKNDPRYRIVVAEHSAPIKGKFIEILGHYDPIHKKVVIKKDEILNWFKKGAKPSNRVAKILKNEGVTHPVIIIKQFKKKPKNKKTDTSIKESKVQPAAPEVKKTESKTEIKKETASVKPENNEKNKPEKPIDAKIPPLNI